jgi:hypothetical protein
VTLAACGSEGPNEGPLPEWGSGPADVEKALREHIEDIQGDDPDLVAAGELSALECEELGESFRGVAVFICSADHGDGALIAEWCAAIVDGRLYTQDSDVELPCTEDSLPAPTSTD